MRIDQLTKEVTLTEYEYKKLIMAQEELLAKIKAEIERRKGELKRYDNDDLIKYRAYDEMISIISSIDDVNETLKINEKMKQREQSFASRSAMSQEVVRNFRYLSTLEKSEKPKNQENSHEAEVNAALRKIDEGFIKQLAEKPVQNDLEEAAEDFGKRQGLELRPFASKFFIAGAKWQKEQMMKEAVEGEISSVDVGDDSYVKTLKTPELQKAIRNCNRGDKVRVIIVK